MPGFNSKPASTTITRNGDSDGIGYVTVNDSTPFSVGASASLSSNGVEAPFEIVDVQPGKVGLRSPPNGPPNLNGLNYGLTSVATFLTGSTLQQYPTFIYSSTVPPKSNTSFSLLNSFGSSVIGSGSLVSNQGNAMTFTRATTKYCDTGLIQDPVQLLPDPEKFDSTATYTIVRSTMTPVGVTPPPNIGAEGTPVYQYADNNVSGSHRTNTISFIVATGTYTISIYAKAGTSNYLNINFNNSPPGWATFDLVNGAVTNQAGTHTTAITDAGNGWWRCSITGAVGTVPAFFYLVHNPNNINSNFPSYVGTGQYVYICAAKVELSSTPTAYQFTGGRNNTRLIQIASGHPDVEPNGYLAELAHTNLIFQSASFTTAPWVDNGVTLTANALIAPDGTNTGWKADWTAGSLYQIVNGTGADGTRYQPAFWMKAITTTGTLDVENPENNTNGRWHIDLSKVSTTQWEWITVNHKSVTEVVPFSSLSNGCGYFFNPGGVANQKCYLWSCDLIAGTYSKSPILTTTGAVTCNADQLSFPLTTKLGTSGRIYTTVIPRWTGHASTFAALFDTRSADIKGVALYVDTGGGLVAFFSDAVTSSTLGSAVVWTANTAYNIQIAWNGGNAWLYVNGTLISSVTNGTNVSPAGSTAIAIGSLDNGTDQFDGWTSNLRITAF